MCSCQKNQTSKDSANFLSSDPGGKGTGLFLVPAPDLGILEFKKVIVQDITIIETIKRGENCEAFKWIHPKEMSASEISNQVAGKLCSGICPGGQETCFPISCFCGGSNWCR